MVSHTTKKRMSPLKERRSKEAVNWADSQSCSDDSSSSSSSDEEIDTMPEMRLIKIRKRTNKDLLLAAENGSYQIIKQIFSNHLLKPDINYKGPDKKTPLYVAASEGHTQIVQILLANGADVETRTIN